MGKDDKASQQHHGPRDMPQKDAQAPLRLSDRQTPNESQPRPKPYLLNTRPARPRPLDTALAYPA